MLVLVILQRATHIMTILPLVEHVRDQVEDVVAFDDRLLPLDGDAGGGLLDLSGVVGLVPFDEVADFLDELYVLHGLSEPFFR